MSNEPSPPPAAEGEYHSAQTPIPTTKDKSGSAIAIRLLETMQSTIDGALGIVRSDQLRHISAEESKSLLTILTKTAQTTWVVAETARIEAASKQTTLATEPEKKKDTVGLANSPAPEFVVSGLVGSISREVWEGLSEAKLTELDEVLRRIVRRFCIDGTNWAVLAPEIQVELAKFGFPFDTAEKALKNRTTWAAMTDVHTSDLSRINALMDFGRERLGEVGYALQMLHVVSRLMDLRGFKA